MTTAAAPATLRPAGPDPLPARPTPPRPPWARGLRPVTDQPRSVAPRSTTAPRLRLLRNEPEPDGPEPAAPAPAVRSVPPIADLHETEDLRRRAHQVLCLVLEVLQGRRTLAHLAPHLEPPALRYVRA